MIDNMAVAMGVLLGLYGAGMYAIARHQQRSDARLTSRQLRRKGGL